MIVDRDTLDVRPIADQLLEAEAGQLTGDAEHPDITWSNELVNHVIELKVTEPARDLTALVEQFDEHVRRVNDRLEPLGARLMGSAMHPWMDPHKEMVIWPHESSDIYRTFDRIFDCRGHGWANLQASHINLPFLGDEQFGRLHAAIRLVLPILPALAAASPFVGGRVTGLLDNRLSVYRTNCAKVPQCAGQVIPEPIFSIDEYHAKILDPLYAALAEHDPQGVLRDEWANARGAIARFSRGTIEIRLLDVQECPAGDLAIAAATTAAARMLVEETSSTFAAQQSMPTDALAAILDSTIRAADAAVIEDANYVRLWGLSGSACSAGQVWEHITAETRRHDPRLTAGFDRQLDMILEHGPLARRMLRAAGHSPTRARLAEIGRRLCDALAAGGMFLG